MLEEVVVEVNQQPFYQILKTCDPVTGKPLMTVYYTEDGNIMFRDLTGNSLEQGTDFVLCDEGDDDEFGQVFKFGNIVTTHEGVFIQSEDGSQDVYRFEVAPYGAVSLEKDYRTLDEILEKNEN